MNPHAPTFNRAPDGEIHSVSCAATNCFAIVAAGIQTQEGYAKIFARQHGDQYSPGRAPDITVDWVLDANCSVCEDFGDVKVDPDGGGLICKDCGTRWCMDGEDGERDVEGEAA